MHCPQVGHRCLTLRAVLTSDGVACCPSHSTAPVDGSSASDSETVSAGTAGTAPSALVPKCWCTRSCSMAETCWRSCLERAALELLRRSSPIMLCRRGIRAGFLKARATVLQRSAQVCTTCTPSHSCLQAGRQLHRVDQACPGLLCSCAPRQPAGSTILLHSSSPVGLCRQGSSASSEAHLPVTC